MEFINEFYKLISPSNYCHLEIDKLNQWLTQNPKVEPHLEVALTDLMAKILISKENEKGVLYNKATKHFNDFISYYSKNKDDFLLQKGLSV